MTYCWYFAREDIEQKTPSREDGIPLETEMQYRRDGARFIINASNTLGLRYDTVATGVVFFHRFFMLQSFKQFDRWVVAAACLLLSGKVEETPKKCKDILKVTHSLLNSQQVAQFGSNPKEELLTHERILLQTIKFDLQLEHPYSYLLKFAKGLKGDKVKIEKLVQMAWTFVNDSLCTTLCLQWEPQAIAVAFIYLAGKLTKHDLQSATHSRSKSWWRQFVDTLDVHDLELICHQVLDIYGESEKHAESEKPPVRPQPNQPQPQQQATPVTTTIPQLMQQQPSAAPAPPPAPPTQLMAAATVGGAPTPTTTMVLQQSLTNLAQQPTSANYTHSSFIGAGGMMTFGLANPLQALQNILPGAQRTASQQATILPGAQRTVSQQATILPGAQRTASQQATILPGAQRTASQQATQLGVIQPQPLAYSTLNVCVASTPTRPTILPASYHMPGISGATMGPNAGKILLPGTTTASPLGTTMSFYQQQAMVAGFQQMSQTRLGGTVPQSTLGQSTVQTAGALPQTLLLPLVKRPALDSTYRSVQSSIVSSPLRPHIPLTPATTPLNQLSQVPVTLGPSYLTVPQQVTPTTPATQLRTQNSLGGGAMTPQLPGQQPHPQQHHGYNPTGGAGWGR